MSQMLHATNEAMTRDGTNGEPEIKTRMLRKSPTSKTMTETSKLNYLISC